MFVVRLSSLSPESFRVRRTEVCHASACLPVVSVPVCVQHRHLSQQREKEWKRKEGRKEKISDSAPQCFWCFGVFPAVLLLLWLAGWLLHTFAPPPRPPVPTRYTSSARTPSLPETRPVPSRPSKLGPVQTVIEIPRCRPARVGFHVSCVAVTRARGESAWRVTRSRSRAWPCGRKTTVGQDGPPLFFSLSLSPSPLPLCLCLRPSIHHYQIASRVLTWRYSATGAPVDDDTAVFYTRETVTE